MPELIEVPNDATDVRGHAMSFVHIASGHLKTKRKGSKANLYQGAFKFASAEHLKQFSDTIKLLFSFLKTYEQRQIYCSEIHTMLDNATYVIVTDKEWAMRDTLKEIRSQVRDDDMEATDAQGQEYLNRMEGFSPEDPK